MIKLINNTVSLNKIKQLSPKQLARLNHMPEQKRNEYLLSLLGLTTHHVRGIEKFKQYGSDRLSNKSASSVLSKMARLKDVTRDHFPGDVAPDTSTGHWIGVELECIIPNNGDFNSEGDCTEDCDHENGECYSAPGDREAHQWLRGQLSKAGVTRVTVKSDRSLTCDDDGIGVECTILFNSKHGFDPLIKLCRVLNDLGCYVDKSCGLHVHLDARHLKRLDVKKIGTSLGCALPILKWMVPENRHTNNYCKLDVSGLVGERYYAINLTAFKKYKTIEVRMHHGSLNATKIINWIYLLKFLSDARLTKYIETFQEFIDLGVSDTLVEYAETRISDLNPSAWAKLNPTDQKIMECDSLVGAA